MSTKRMPDCKEAARKNMEESYKRLRSAAMESQGQVIIENTEIREGSTMGKEACGPFDIVLDDFKQDLKKTIAYMESMRILETVKATVSVRFSGETKDKEAAFQSTKVTDLIKNNKGVEIQSRINRIVREAENQIINLMRDEALSMQTHLLQMSTKLDLKDFVGTPATRTQKMEHETNTPAYDPTCGLVVKV